MEQQNLRSGIRNGYICSFRHDESQTVNYRINVVFFQNTQPLRITQGIVKRFSIVTMTGQANTKEIQQSSTTTKITTIALLIITVVVV